MEEKGIKEMLELIAGVKEIAMAVKDVMADGKVGLADLPVVLDLIKKQEILVAAFSGLSELKAEAKDLSADESMIIIAAIFSAAKDFKSVEVVA